MKKFLLIAALALSLAACGGGGGSDEPEVVLTPQQRMDKTMTEFCKGGYWKGVNPSHPGFDTITYDVRCDDSRVMIFTFDREGNERR